MALNTTQTTITTLFLDSRVTTIDSSNLRPHWYTIVIDTLNLTSNTTPLIFQTNRITQDKIQNIRACRFQFGAIIWEINGTWIFTQCIVPGQLKGEISGLYAVMQGSHWNSIGKTEKTWMRTWTRKLGDLQKERQIFGREVMKTGM